MWFGYYYLLGFAVGAYAQNFEGQTCHSKHHQTTGICKKLSDCTIAQDDLKKSIPPENCGFVGNKPIVCCPDKEKIVRNGPVGRKSIEKCKEFRRRKRVSRATENVKHPAEDDIHSILGGVFVKPNEYPHMAAIGYISENEEIVYGCGASLISERFLLSAAHCAYHLEHGPAKIAKLGTLSLKPNKTNEYNIVKIIKHPEHKRPSVYHDITLFELDVNLTFSPNIFPICLHTTHNINSNAANAAGWGRTGFLEDPSELLQTAPLQLFNITECQRRYPPYGRRLDKGILEDSQICAGSRDNQTDTCNGDSGGPLQVGYHIIGITSFGKYCGVADAYAIYTRVSKYIDWIEANVW